MATLVDTNILVYVFDGRDREKQGIAGSSLLQIFRGVSIHLAHQSLLEFFNAVTRQAAKSSPILSRSEAIRAVEGWLRWFPVLYPTAEVLRLALKTAGEHQLSWWDAHMLAYALHYGMDELWSADFQHGREYGPVKIVNPFLA